MVGFRSIRFLVFSTLNDPMILFATRIDEWDFFLCVSYIRICSRELPVTKLFLQQVGLLVSFVYKENNLCVREKEISIDPNVG